MATAYKYGMRLRGFGPGTCPVDGWLDTEEDPVPDGYWNILIYNRKLTDEELSEYELDYLGKRTVP